LVVEKEIKSMSVLKFELKEEHVKLLKNLRWSIRDNVIVNMFNDGEDYIPPFGEDNLYEAMDIILNGVPEDFDPMTTDSFKEYSSEQKSQWDKLYSELPIALDIVLFNGNYELGTYKTKWHLRNWIKIK
jgi:hypothetical protein